MNVQLVDPPQVENQVRGIGVYSQNLKIGLDKIAGCKITRENPELTHFLYFDPFFLTMPPIRKTKTVVTIFDLTPIVLESLYPRGIRGEIKWQIQKRLVKTVEGIITISESAKRDIIKYIGISPNKIYVTMLGAGSIYKGTSQKRENFVLYIGDVNRNKNLINLIRAVAQLDNAKLILVGKAFLNKNLPEVTEINEMIVKLDLTNRVEMTGYVSDQEKTNLLLSAGVYCQPSIYEGFGLSVLEAMAMGVPVVCGHNSALPEVSGDAAIYANVLDPTDLASKLRKVLEMKADERKRIVLMGFKQAGKFSWDKTAKETYEVYKNILAGK